MFPFSGFGSGSFLVVIINISFKSQIYVCFREENNWEGKERNIYKMAVAVSVWWIGRNEICIEKSTFCTSGKHFLEWSYIII